MFGGSNVLLCLLLRVQVCLLLYELRCIFLGLLLETDLLLDGVKLSAYLADFVMLWKRV